MFRRVVPPLGLRNPGGTCETTNMLQLRQSNRAARRFGDRTEGLDSMRVLTAVSALALLGLVAAAGEARAVVIVVGGGAGAQCYSTAEYGDPFQAFDICSKALSDQEMSVRDRGATYINRSVVRLRVHDYNGAIADCDLALVRVPTI